MFNFRIYYLGSNTANKMLHHLLSNIWYPIPSITQKGILLALFYKYTRIHQQVKLGTVEKNVIIGEI